MRTFTGRKGSLELKVGDQVIHSLLDSKAYPEEAAAVAAVKAALATK